MKKCTKCLTEKELDNFSKNGKYTASWCKQCKAILEQAKRIKRGIQPRVKPVVQDDENKECLKCGEIKHVSSYTPNNRGRLGVSAYCKDCQEEYRKTRIEANQLKHKNESKLATQKYRDSRRAHWRALHRLNMYKRRTGINAQSDGTVTEEFMRSLYASTHCCWCGDFISEDKRTAEHIIPLSEGGVHGVSNLKMACLSCNCSKKNCKNKNNYVNKSANRSR